MSFFQDIVGQSEMVFPSELSQNSMASPSIFGDAKKWPSGPKWHRRKAPFFGHMAHIDDLPIYPLR
jgi:hypothetical protein